MNGILIDTDVMIDFLRGEVKAKKYLLANFKNLNISVITVAELFAGVREGEERDNLEEAISSIAIIPMDTKIAMLGGIYKRDYRKSHNISITDTLIAATAEINNLALKTFNIKHFPMLKTISAPYKKG